MTNTTKTLEETIDRMQVAPCGEYVPPSKERLLEIAREIQNSTLDACRENIKGISVAAITFGGTETGEFIEREATLSAIDSLRTGSGKEV